MKVSTDKHLEDTIGAKPAKRVAKPKTAAADSGPKRVREINVATATPDAAKDTAKRRILQRQSGVFRSSDFLKRELVRNSRKKKTTLN